MSYTVPVNLLPLLKSMRSKIEGKHRGQIIDRQVQTFDQLSVNILTVQIFAVHAWLHGRVVNQYGFAHEKMERQLLKKEIDI